MKPNEGIYQDGFAAAFIHNASPVDNGYGTMTASPHLHFQRWSWLSGYVDGLKAKIEQDAAAAHNRRLRMPQRSDDTADIEHKGRDNQCGPGNPLVLAYLERERDRLQAKELRRLAESLREEQTKLRPMQEQYWTRLWANRRTEGEAGFVMIRPATQ